jgi:hypothetical protein
VSSGKHAGWDCSGRVVPRALVALVAIAAASGCAVFRMGTAGARFAVGGQTIELRERDDAIAPLPRPKLLLLAIDGVDRDLLYGLLRDGSMPRLAGLLGMSADGPRRVHFDETITATLPSDTAVAWATIATGAPPAVHGVVGNEMFLRGERRFVAPVPASTDDPSDMLATYTGGLVNDLLLAPTIYERMRALDPGVRIWVAMHQVYRGADVLLLPDRAAMLDAMRVIVQEKVRSQISDEDASAVYEELDGDVAESVEDELDDDPPDVLTVYLPGTDLYAHTAEPGPDAARRDYLPRVVDPLLGELADALREHGALDDRWIVVTSDHGHTQVVHDDAASLGVDADGEPEQVLERAGFRVRPFGVGVETTRPDFDAVLAYQGGFAYVYLADRATCPEPGRECDWTKPPRLRDDVLAAAEAFHRANRAGEPMPELKDALEMILVRDPAKTCANGSCFRVYAGGGKTFPLRAHLRAHPHPNWPRFEARLGEMASGPAADRVGDLVLVARAGDEVPLAQRRYFAPPYRSYHGSPARKDSEVPLIVAYPAHDAAFVDAAVARGLRGSHAQAAIGKLLIELRYGAPSVSAGSSLRPAPDTAGRSPSR